VLDPTRYWQCPTCDAQHITRTAQVTTPGHACPQLAGLSVPYVECPDQRQVDGARVRHRVIERADFVGREHGVRHDGNGRAVMAVHTERADGSHDTTVFPATAMARMEI
jgi:hypothetical protein